MPLLDLFRNADLPSFATLFSEINTDMGNTQIWEILVIACGMLAVHAICVLAIAGAYHYINLFMTRKRIFGASFLSYFIAILLIIASHLSEIVVWAYICVGLKVFPTNPQTFYFAGEMMIYMQALRFLTDYLLNDRYYGRKYPTHNKVRAENQIRLMQAFQEAI